MYGKPADVRMNHDGGLRRVPQVRGAARWLMKVEPYLPNSGAVDLGWCEPTPERGSERKEAGEELGDAETYPTSRRNC
jgi:hypothetical protein